MFTDRTARGLRARAGTPTPASPSPGPGPAPPPPEAATWWTRPRAVTRVTGHTPPAPTRPDGTPPATCSAHRQHPGWFYEYGDTCPVASCGNLGRLRNEKTGSGGAVIASAAPSGTVPSQSAPRRARTPAAGTSGPRSSTDTPPTTSPAFPRRLRLQHLPGHDLYRASQRDTLAPPPGGISGSGERQGRGRLLLPPGRPGFPPTSIQARNPQRHRRAGLLARGAPRELHDCRHEPGKTGTACDEAAGSATISRRRSRTWRGGSGSAGR